MADYLAVKERLAHILIPLAQAPPTKPKFGENAHFVLNNHIQQLNQMASIYISQARQILNTCNDNLHNNFNFLLVPRRINQHVLFRKRR